MAASSGAAIAQTPYTASLRVDNDAFDFWMLPWNRPDEEYSSGVRIALEGGDAPAWARRLLNRPACVVAAQRCRSERLEIGQNLYTPARSSDNPVPGPGARPNAGWLYVSQTARALSSSRSDELTVTIGVTGPPSLGEVTQRIAHGVAPSLNRPADWSEQIRFEPGVILGYEQKWRIGTHDQRRFGFDLIPRWGASVGNVSTFAEAGFQLRAGWHLRHPWLPEGGPVEVALAGGLSARAVARDLFLDGNTFGDGPNVGHEALLGAGDVGVQVRLRRIFLAYRAVNDTRSYANGPKWHPWASMVGGITFDR
jgi:lipid A 3-O-deacylase